MTSPERQQIIDIAKLQINEYFDHYLTEVFPEQIDRIMSSHNSDGDAHPIQFATLEATSSKVSRATWMMAGMSILVSFVVTAAALAKYWWPS